MLTIEIKTPDQYESPLLEVVPTAMTTGNL
jgi:hypothetical protein